MPKIRVRPETGTLYLDFRYRGVRCREQTLLVDTPENRSKLGRLGDRIDKALANGSFVYADFFPGSKRAATFADGPGCNALAGAVAVVLATAGYRAWEYYTE